MCLTTQVRQFAVQIDYNNGVKEGVLSTTLRHFPLPQAGEKLKAVFDGQEIEFDYSQLRGFQPLQ